MLGRKNQKRNKKKRKKQNGHDFMLDIDILSLTSGQCI